MNDRNAHMAENRDFISEKELRRLAEALIAEQKTMTLATARDNLPWAAPVYYATIGFVFYFFSDPASRHITESVEKGRASAAIYAPAEGWKDIRGIQMTGTVSPLRPGVESLKAIRAYLKKFPFTKEFFEGTQDLDVDAFVKRFKVRFYRFQPNLMYYLDNSIRFSFREAVPLSP